MKIITKSYKLLMKLRSRKKLLEQGRINAEVKDYYRTIKTLYALENMFESFNSNEKIVKVCRKSPLTV